MMDNKYDVAYFRLSLEDDDVARGENLESISIGSQRMCINDYSRLHDDVPKKWEEYVDDGYSGTSMDRPAMNKLLQLVAMGRVRTIIVRDLSRFARNYLEAGHYLEYVFPAYDVRFISINDNYDSAKISYDEPAAFQLVIRNLINDMYSKDISKKIKSAVDIKKLSGEYVYGQAPYGYKKGEKKNTIVIDPEAAAVVKQIFEWAVAGVTVTQIAKRLNESKVLTPSVYLSEVRGKYKTRPYWTFESVRNILINRIYTGDTVPFKSRVVRVGSNRVKMIPEEEQIIIPDTHEAIISREAFYQARLVIKSNTKSKKSTPTNPFSGYLVCGCCGNRLSKGKASNKNWLCPSARYTDETECKHVRANEELLRSNVVKAIKVQCDLADANVQAAKSIQKNENKRCESYEWEIKNVERSIADGESEVMQALEKYYADGISKEEFLNIKAGINAKKTELSARLVDLQGKVDLIKKQITENQDLEITARTVAEHRDIDSLDCGLMKALIKSIIIYPNNAVHINWNFSL